MMRYSPPALILGLAALLFLAGSVQAHGLNQGPESGPEAPLEASNEALPFELGGPFALIDHTGSLRSRADFNGQFHIIYFGYTECPYTCSTAATNIAVVLDELADGGHDLGALFITIDPTYDSPERLAAYVAKIHPKLIGLTGEVEEIERVQKSFRVHAQEAADKGGFERLYDHQPLAFLMGPSGDILTFFPPILPPPAITGIIERYL